MPPKQTDPLPLEAFIRHLKDQGFVVGVDQHLRLQAVFQLIGPETAPADIKYMLAPLFAASRRQQNQFYKAFDRFFAYLEAPRKSGTTVSTEPDIETAASEPAPPPFAKNWVVLAVGVMAFLIIGLVAYIGEKPLPTEGPKVTPPPIKEPNEVQPGQTLKPRITIALGTITPAPSPQEVRRNFLRAYLKWLGLGFPWLLFLLIELRRRQKKRFVLQKKRMRGPPFTWPLRAPAPDLQFLKTHEWYATARALRRRLASDVLRPDIPQTVKKAIAKAGFAEKFYYKALTRPPEYLFLIDLPSHRDHQARLFDAQAAILAQEDIFIRRYFFCGDPRICFQEIGGRPIEFSDIRQRHGADKRLLLFSDGEGLLDPSTGRLEAWTESLRHFQSRALMTPRPPSDWALAEKELAKMFIVLPATAQSLSAMIEYFEFPNRYRLGQWARSGAQDDRMPIDPENLADVARWLGADTYDWLRACAVYPEIDWNLTLFLGVRFGHDLALSNIRRLIRLPWFKRGRMPEEIRWQLIDQIEPQRFDAIRHAIGAIMAQNPPPPDSAAHDPYRLYLAAYHPLPLPHKEVKPFKAAMQSAGETALKEDVCLLRVMESRSARALELLMNPRLKQLLTKRLFRQNLSFFGVKTSIWALAALIIFVASLFLPYPRVDTPKPIPVTMDFTLIQGRPPFYFQATAVTSDQWMAVVRDEPFPETSLSVANMQAVVKLFNLGALAQISVEGLLDNMQTFVKGLNRVLGASDFRLITSEEWKQVRASNAAFQGMDEQKPFWIVRSVRLSDYAEDGLIPMSIVKLRDTPKALSEEDVKAMLKRYNFFDIRWNPSGNFANDFKDNGNGTVTDRNTGLMWQKGGSKYWIPLKEVDQYVRQVNQERLGGYNDWRLPTLEELTSLLESQKMKSDLYIDPVFDNKQSWCWSADAVKGSSGLAWVVRFYKGDVYKDYFLFSSIYVRVVRAGQ